MRIGHKKHLPFQHNHRNQALSLLKIGNEAINTSHLVLSTSELRKHQHAFEHKELKKTQQNLLQEN